MRRKVEASTKFEEVLHAGALASTDRRPVSAQHLWLSGLSHPSPRHTSLLGRPFASSVPAPAHSPPKGTTMSASATASPDTRVRRRLPFWAQVLIGLALGIVLGFLARAFALDWLTETLNTVGTIFVQLLRVIVVPLVLTALIVSITQLRHVTNAARLAVQTLVWFAITALVSVVIGIGIGVLTNPGASATISLDDFYRDVDAPGLPMSPLGIPDWDDVGTWDLAQAVDTVGALLRDGRAELPTYDISKSRRVGEHIVDRREQIVSANVYIDAVFLQRLIELVDGFTVKVHFLKALQLLGSELADLFALFKQLVQALLGGLGVLLGRGVLFLGGLLFAAAGLRGNLHVIRLFQQRVGHLAQFLFGVNMFF